MYTNYTRIFIYLRASCAHGSQAHLLERPPAIASQAEKHVTFGKGPMAVVSAAQSDASEGSVFEGGEGCAKT